jgi:hypothetical protein
LVGLLLLEVRRDRLHDLLSSRDVVDHQSVEEFGGSELELGDRVLLVLLYSDLFRFREVLLLTTHDLDELLEVLDFLRHLFLVPLIIIRQINHQRVILKSILIPI